MRPDGAFSNCEKITSVEIPATVNSINGNALPACTRLTKIIVPDENPAFCSVNGVLFNKDKTTLLIFPSGKEGGYTIPGSTTDINALAPGIYILRQGSKVRKIAVK